ncbi:MAG TPA: DUF1203 domain-containing protein [Nocardioidaceae bacterium]|nr:DUF1203 domain-containing protein [Nocardioidaceae bacterium]
MSTPTSVTSLRIHAIEASTLRRLRAQGHDDFGHRWEPRIAHEGGEPLRCCLRDARPGDSIVLISYAPVGESAGDAGSYDEVGPVFVHADECGGPADQDRYPSEWMTRSQVLRAYRANGTIAGGVRLKPGDDRDDAARRLLADPEVAFLHSRNVVYGCYMLEIRRD